MTWNQNTFTDILFGASLYSVFEWLLLLFIKYTLLAVVCKKYDYFDIFVIILFSSNSRGQ